MMPPKGTPNVIFFSKVSNKVFAQAVLGEDKEIKISQDRCAKDRHATVTYKGFLHSYNENMWSIFPTEILMYKGR